MTTKILQAARERSAIIATAESCTAGMVAAAITATPGASDIFDRGFVTYSNAAKIEMLGVSADTIERYGAVSEEVAAEMASGALKHSQANLALSVTGIAGPGGSAHKPEGRVCFGLARPGVVHTETVEFGALGRDNVRLAACDHGLRLITDALVLARK